MKLKIYKNINECRKLWKKFSPNRKLFDVWDYRMCFFNKDEDNLHFIAKSEGGNVVGLIPLCHVKSNNQYTYFGGWFPERNSFFSRDKTDLAQMLQHCPANTVAEGLDPGESKYYNFLNDEYTYYIDLLRYHNNFEKYFSSFGKKKQKNFRSDIKKIPKYKIYYNRTKDFNRLVELNINQFDEDSIFNSKAIKSGVYKMINLANKNGILQMISLKINGKVEAVDVGLMIGRWYHVVTGSSNNQKIPNLGKLMTILSIKNAITKKARFVDFLASSGYWKKQWDFDKEMLLKFVK